MEPWARMGKMVFLRLYKIFSWIELQWSSWSDIRITFLSFNKPLKFKTLHYTEGHYYICVKRFCGKKLSRSFNLQFSKKSFLFCKTSNKHCDAIHNYIMVDKKISVNFTVTASFKNGKIMTCFKILCRSHLQGCTSLDKVNRFYILIANPVACKPCDCNFKSSW